VCVCVCVCMCVCMYLYVCVCVCVCRTVYVCKTVYVCLSVESFFYRIFFATMPAVRFKLGEQLWYLSTYEYIHSIEPLH